MKDNREHMCMLPKSHDSECNGHETSRDLVPPEATKMIIPFLGTIFYWESDQIPGVWLAYANPPHDVMSQGKVDAGHNSAITSLIRTIQIIEQEYC
jgi:hypothetical protein